MPATEQPIGERSAIIIGNGLAGSLMAILLARRGHSVDIYERSADPRTNATTGGRSINLALAERGMHALEQAGVMEHVRPLLIPMRGRMLHDTSGAQTYVPYGQPQEAIYSVSRDDLNRVLVEHAAQIPGLRMHFMQRCTGADFDARTLTLRDEVSGNTRSLPLYHTIAADGAGSVLRNAMIRSLEVRCTEDILEHGYKELTIPPRADGSHALERQALHIWPRGKYMLIALPNLDGSFTATLFLARDGEPSFFGLNTANQVREFFGTSFPDVLQLMPELCNEFFAHPTGIMGTIRCERWSVDDALTLLGDAAHAIVPFHAQGMNCAFEDCHVLDAFLKNTDDWQASLREFDLRRHPDTDAIATMALENYLEMRDTVRDPKFQLQKLLSLELERRHPQRFVPRYSMVMFHAEIPYSVAYERGKIQAQILDELTAGVDSLEAVDMDLATALIEARLTPIG